MSSDRPGHPIGISGLLLPRIPSAMVAMVVMVLLAGLGVAASPSFASSPHVQSYARISGDGSSWAGNALLQWQSDVASQGLTVDYNPDGSSAGRRNFAQGLSDFAVSEIPYTGDAADPQDTVRPNFAYSLLPVVAGAVSLMYNLPVGGSRLETLQLTQSTVAGIFSGQITRWNDPAIAASNPGVDLPAQQITVVVRSDGAGVTAQLTTWMLRQFPQAWQTLCTKSGCNPNAATSYFPYQGLPNFTAQSGSNGVTTYTANTPFTINYDEFSYALGVGFPVVRLQNAAGFYTTPTDTAVAVALTQARINADASSANYLSQDLSGVYTYGDPRTYPISAYTYLIVPSQTTGTFTQAKGAALGAFAAYDICQGQQSMGALGYSPLPMNLVLAGMDQILKIPGVDQATQDLIASTRSGVASGTGDTCDNPTFAPGDDSAHNRLLDSAPFPAGCDAACQAPWSSHPSYAVTVTTSGAGTGAITSAPAGVACGTVCTTAVPPGTQLTLTAVPAIGSVFSGWSGCDSSVAAQCTVAVNSARVVSAAFDTATVSPQLTPTTQPATKAPRTRVTHVRIARSTRTATFAFTARPTNEPAKFQCKLSGQSRRLNHWRHCASGITYKHLAPRTHVFHVRAMVNGLKDATPAKLTF